MGWPVRDKGGILSVEDALRAAEVGRARSWCPIMGGRQLDSSPAPIEVLPEIVDAVGDRMEVILEGGVRRGVHVLKALALGATAFSRRPTVSVRVGAGGEAGVDRALEILRTDIERDIRILGCRNVGEVDANRIRRVPGVSATDLTTLKRSSARR
ncbi:MAG: hypothetical protein CM1200mP36_00120 [Gammaproteobacteria bacterium]|nr:MAG: hypothetical protein CM1200mP36_00120 [Gammaproteobacteria bacterium]